MRACVEYSQTREFEKALDYADVSQRVVSDAEPFDDVCKYRSSMINCSCQDTRYFARAYRNPVSTGETDSAYNFRSPTVGEFSPLSPLFSSSRWTLSRCQTFASFATALLFPPLSPPSPLVHVIADDEFWWKRRDTCAPFCEQWSKRRRKRSRLSTEKNMEGNFSSLSLKFLLFVIDRHRWSILSNRKSMSDN